MKKNSLPFPAGFAGNKKRILAALAGAVLSAAASLALFGCAGRDGGSQSAQEARTEEVPDTSTESYGVFLGVDQDSFSIDLFEGYDFVVVDAQELRREQLAQLHAKGHTVFSYLNVGSIEDSRDYYEDFRDICLDRYKNWPEENWVDVTQESWQSFVTDGLLERVYAQDPALDGLFLDNLDVYFHMANSRKYRAQGEAAFEALVGILQEYAAKGIPVLVNGADEFVDRLISEKLQALLMGVNQENVFTVITDYRRDGFDAQEEEETDYFTEYLERCGRAGLKVFLLEYTDDPEVEAQIAEYCRGHSYRYYISRHVNLAPEAAADR